MAIVKQMIRENDVVELLGAVDKVEGPGKWPAGTIGTVVSDHGDVKLVEIAENRPPGQMLDLITVDAARLKLLGKHTD
jgi:hypothetical protein